MKQNIRLFRTPSSLWSKFLDSNPQFFREIKGKLKTRNVIIATALSVVAQFLAVIFLLGQFPDASPEPIQAGRYGVVTYDTIIYHIKDEFGHWLVNWQLWWLDLFITLSFISIFALLVVGSYMLIADLVKEEARGTLNFIRLTPQSAGSVLLGKIMGVPILLYIAIALIFPLHLVAGLQSRIPLNLILVFDLTVAASCSFIYCLVLLWSLLNIGMSGSKPWVATSLLGFMLLLSTAILLDGYSNLDHFLASLLIFNPGIVLSYLIDAAQFEYGKAFSFLSVEKLGTLSFYGQALWTKTSIGIGVIFFNFSLWTYWCWSILKRRFHNPEKTILSKVHSYWLTALFTVIALGFTLQKDFLSKNAFHYVAGEFSSFQHHLNNNFFCLQIFLSLFSLGLVFALTPNRQTLHDWARYRHQKSDNSLWKELVFGENSPSSVAVAINLAIAIAFIIPSMVVILAPSQRYLFWGFVLSATNIMLCAVVCSVYQN